MIIVFGGIKGGEGKTTLATHFAILRASAKRDVLLVDADEQRSASDFSYIRSELLGQPDYSCVQITGSAVRSEALRLAPKHDDIVIDVGGRDSAGQRAALSIANVFAVPLFPASYDLWAFQQIGSLIEEAKAFNPTFVAAAFLNRADPSGKDNEEAATIARETPSLTYIDTPLVNRKVWRSSASKGQSVTEYKPLDTKAINELKALYNELCSLVGEVKVKSKRGSR